MTMTERNRPLRVLAWLSCPVLACLLLSAHFYRAGLLELAVAAALLPLLLVVPRPWTARVVQGALVLGAIEWLRTLTAFAAVRISMGQPYARLVIILLLVALLTAVSALVFRAASVRARYRLDVIAPA